MENVPKTINEHADANVLETNEQPVTEVGEAQDLTHLIVEYKKKEEEKKEGSEAKVSIMDRIKNAFKPKLTSENVQDKLKDLMSTRAGQGYSGADYIQFANKYNLSEHVTSLANAIYTKGLEVQTTDDAKALQIELNQLKQAYAKAVREEVSGNTTR